MLFGDFAESQSRGFNEAIDEGESTEDFGYLSGSDLEDDEDEKVPSIAGSGLQVSNVFGSGAENKISPEDYKEGVEKGKVVKIPDVAFMT